MISVEKNEKQNIQINQRTCRISGWQTDVVSIDHHHHHDYHTSLTDNHTTATTSTILYPHTIFLFIPGNPGCVEWYIDMLYKIVETLGVGYAVRGISHAGHGVGENMIEVHDNHNDNGGGVRIPEAGKVDHNSTTGRSGTASDFSSPSTTEEEPSKHYIPRLKRKAKIAFTIDGQVEHKLEWIDLIHSEMISLRQEQMDQNSMGSNNDSQSNSHLNSSVKFVFLTHSFGAHLVQRILLLRRDILLQTKNIIHVTPFFRFDPDSWFQKQLLATLGNAPKFTIQTLKSLMYIISFLPPKLVDLYMEKVASMPLAKDRKLAIDLYSQPQYIRNFFNLGCEEIREIPEVFDLSALQIIGESCPTSILYSPHNDHWAPLSHMEEIIQAKKENSLPANITVEYDKNIVHGFVVFPEMVRSVVHFVVKSVLSSKDSSNTADLQSKL